jgi:hypothetical protein
MVELREGRSDTGGLTDLENNATRIVQARMLDKIHFPTFCGFGQFRIYILSLVKETNCTAGKKRRSVVQKERQGRQGSGHNTINLWNVRGRPERFEPRHMDMRSDPGSPGCFPGLLDGWEEQGDQNGDDRNHHQKFDQRKSASRQQMSHRNLHA